MNPNLDLRRCITNALLQFGRTTRPDMLEIRPVRPATLYAVIREMTDEGLLHEPERTRKHTGSKASPIEFNPRAGWFLGLELAPHYVFGVVCDMTGQVVHTEHVSNRRVLNAETGYAAVASVLKDIRNKLGPDWTLVKRLGFADPGLVDSQTGRSLIAVSLEGWEMLDTARWLSESSGLKVEVLAASAARAFAEYEALRGQQITRLLHISLDEGIGAGLVAKESGFQNSRYNAMEIGHVIIDEDGPLCECGHRGCLEAVAGLKAIGRMVKTARSKRGKSILTQAPFTLDRWITAVSEQDPLALEAQHIAATAVGKALAVAVNLLAPDYIMCSGKLTRLGSRFIDLTTTTMRERSLPQISAGIRIGISTYGHEGTAIGAAQWVRHQYLTAWVDRQHK